MNTREIGNPGPALEWAEFDTIGAMQAESSLSRFEVYCQRCGVTFPIGTKRCLHCGVRLARTRAAEPRPIAFEPAMESPLELPDEGTPRRLSRFSPISILWIVAALAVGIQRACSS